MSEFAPEQFQNIARLSGFDYLTSGTQPSEKGVAPAQRNTLRVWTPGGWSAEERKRFGMWEITLRDFSQQGLNHPDGLFSQNSNGYSWSELLTDKPGEMTLPPSVVTYGSPDPTTIVGIHSAFIFDRLIVGAGSNANNSLWKETSATDPTPSAITYSPGSSICSLAATVDDGVARLAVGRIGAATQLHSDASATIATTMHTSTNSMWGMITSGVNATDAGVPVMLIYAGTVIGTKATNADLTTAITPVQTVRAGGFAIGAITPKGRAQRAYWAIPRYTNTAGALLKGSEAVMDIWSTNMEASDLLPFTSKYCPNGIYQAIPFRDGLAYSDLKHVAYWDGQEEFDLGAFRKRPGVNPYESLPTSAVASSDVIWRSIGLVSNGTDLHQLVFNLNRQELALASSSVLERYNYEAGSWHKASARASGNTSLSVSPFPLYGGAMPYSPNTNRAFAYDTSSIEIWNSFFVSPPAESLLWQWNVGSGTYSTGIPTYETVGGWLSPRWLLDGIEYNPKVVTEVDCYANLDTSGANATERIRVFGDGVDGARKTAYDNTFAQAKTIRDYRRKNNGWVNIHDVQVFINLVPHSSTKIFNALPDVIRGLYSKTEQPITDTHRPSVESMLLV